ncbi:MAG: hypothetical protein R3C19_08455 [Planctomycetaceae bacterium]
MATETSHALQHLHHLLQQLEAAETLLAHGPRRIAAAEKKIVAGEQACNDQKAQIQTVRKAADQKSLSLKSREADIQKLSRRLNEASSNKEYDIIMAQVTAEKTANAKLEDEILSLLTQVDEATTELSRLQKEVEAAQERALLIGSEVKEREPGVVADVERLKAEIREAETAIPAGECFSAYRRLVQSMASAALAEMDGGFCTACNTRVTPQDAVRINLGEFVMCRECGRIQYTIAE